MSWLVARKRGKKVISYEYRWKERGVTKSRSTGTADRSIALKVQKKWDAAATLHGTAILSGEQKSTDLTISGQMEQFLKEKRIEIKPGTVKRYEYHARFLQEFFKKRQVKFFDQLSAALMREYKTERLGAGRSQKTVFEELAFFRGLIRRLVEEETLERDPVRAWPKLQKRIPAKPETLGFYTVDEISKLLTYFNGKEIYDFVFTAFLTGARLGELKNLKIWDIDLAAGIIRFTNEKTVTSYGNVHKFLPIHQDLFPVLQQRVKNALPAAWLFPEIRVRHEAWPRDQLQWACRALGIQYKRFHGTRHSFGTLMLETGATITEISHALGHTNLTTTQRYSHMRPVRLEKLNRLKIVGLDETRQNNEV
jgi:integrase